MFLEVQSALRLDQRTDRSSAVVAIEEEEDQLGAFLVHHFLGTSIKNRRKVVFVGLEQSLGHYSAVALKNGINLHKFRDTGQLVFIEGLKNYADAYLGDAGDGFDFVARPRDREVLKQLYKRVEQEVNKAGPGCASTTVIVDKLSVLLSLGVPANDVVIFARYLQSMVQKRQKGCEVVLLPRRDPDDVDEALNSVSAYLTRSSDLVVRCWPLCSGKSSSVTGNLCFEWSAGGACGETGRFQFRVDEKTVRVFALGASRDVL